MVQVCKLQCINCIFLKISQICCKMQARCRCFSPHIYTLAVALQLQYWLSAAAITRTVSVVVRGCRVGGSSIILQATVREIWSSLHIKIFADGIISSCQVHSPHIQCNYLCSFVVFLQKALLFRLIFYGTFCQGGREIAYYFCLFFNFLYKLFTVMPILNELLYPLQYHLVGNLLSCEYIIY